MLDFILEIYEAIKMMWHYYLDLWDPYANFFENIFVMVMAFVLFVIAVGGGISMFIGSMGCLISIIGKPFGFVIPFFDPDKASYTSEDVYMGSTSGSGVVQSSTKESKGRALRELYDDCSADLLEKEERDWEARNVTRVGDPAPKPESKPDDYWQTNTYDYN